MALTITSTTGNSTVSGPTLPIASITAAVGDWLVVLVAANNAGALGVASLTGVTDSAGNTYTSRGITNRTPGNVAADGTTHGQFTCQVTSPLAGGTVTINFSPDTIVKAAIVFRIQAPAGQQIFFDQAGTGVTGAGTTWSTGTFSVADGTTIFASTAVKVNAQSTADSDTTNGNWSSRTASIADTGVATTSQTITAQTKTVTATGNQSFDAGTGASRQYAVNWLSIYTQVVETGGTATGTGTATGVLELTSVSGGLATGTGTATGNIAADVAAAGHAAGEGRARGVTTYERPPSYGRRSIRILLRFNWKDGFITRLWLGSGIYADPEGNIWAGAGMVDEEQLEDVQQAINGDAAGLDVGVSGISSQTATRIWNYQQEGNLLGSIFSLMLQTCDQNHRPAGPLRTMYSGTIVNSIFEESTTSEQRFSNVIVQTINKFSLRRVESGSVLSDADQRIYSARINPGDTMDRSCERITLMQTKRVVWPRYT